MKRVEELTLKLIDGVISEGETNELDRLVRGDEKAAGAHIALLELEADLRGQAEDVDVARETMWRIEDMLAGRIGSGVLDRIKARGRRGRRVRAWRGRHGRSASPRRGVLGRVAIASGAVAATIVVAVAGWVAFENRYEMPQASGSYRIAGGEQLRRGSVLHAEDGASTLSLGGYCLVELKPGTALRVQGEERNELVFLLRGEVACEVDRRRGAFAVETGLGKASATGTRFTVALTGREGTHGMTGRRMLVRVLAGTVLVSGAPGSMAGEYVVKAGEEKTIAEGAGWMPVVARARSPGVRVTGAQVPEHRVGETIHVNNQHPDASDHNPGSTDAPLTTVSRAVKIAEEKNRRGTGTRIMIHPGTYRESVFVPHDGGATDAPIVIEGAQRGKVVISGSDVWTGWQRHRNTGTYVHPWPYRWGLAPYPPGWKEAVVLRPVTRRREMIFVGGRPLRQVLSPAELREGCFHVSEEKGIAYIRPWADADMKRATVEVAVRSGLLRIDGRRNVLVRGLVFQHDNTPVEATAVQFGDCRNVMIEDCTIHWNNWSGFGFWQCEDVTARRLRINHNGGCGGGGYGVRNILWEDIEHSYNNWRGHMGEFHGWAVGGCKFYHVHGGIFRRTRSVGNQCYGFWFDCNCVNVLVDEAYWCDNLTDAVFIEANQGPITITDSILAFNGHGAVRSTNSSRVTLENNVIYGNGSSQVWTGGNEIRKVQNHFTGEEMTIRVEHWTLKDNVVVGVDRGQNLLGFAPWGHFLSSVKAEGNLYYNPEKKRAFRLGNMDLDLDEWQLATGQDLNAYFGDPMFEDPKRGRFRPLPASPLRRKGEWRRREVRGGGLAGLLALKRRQIRSNWADAYPLAERAKDTGWASLDLKAFANRPLSGRYGCVGGGLDHLPPGRKLIHGVPFDILDQNLDGVSIIALRSGKISDFNGRPAPREVVIPVGRRIRALYVLHGCGWASKHEKAAEYQLVYQDGTRSSVDIVAYGAGSEHKAVFERLEKDSNIQDWWPTFPQFENESARHVIVAKEENPLEYTRYLYTLQIVNRAQHNVVNEIRLVPNPDVDTSVFVLAITALAAE